MTDSMHHSTGALHGTRRVFGEFGGERISRLRGTSMRSLGLKSWAAMRSRTGLILRNGTTTIGLFQGMFEQNILTFNPGWDWQAQPVESFTDVRELQKQLKAQGVELINEADEDTTGPESFVAVDPGRQSHSRRPARVRGRGAILELRRDFGPGAGRRALGVGSSPISAKLLATFTGGKCKSRPSAWSEWA